MVVCGPSESPHARARHLAIPTRMGAASIVTILGCEAETAEFAPARSAAP